MRKWNKLLALVLAMVMVFGLTATAFAEEGKTDDPAPTETTEPENKDEAAEPAEGEDAKEPAEGEDAPEATEPAEGEDAPEATEPTEGEDAPETTEPEAYPYADVADWAKEHVTAIMDKKLMDVDAEGSFNAAANMTRVDLVVALYRLAGSPSVEGKEATFEDIAELTDEQKAAIVWAASEKIVNGESEAAFNPNGNVERQQIAKILFVYAKAEKVEEDNLAAFSDKDEVEEYAVDCLNWLVATKIMNGDDGKLVPAGNATREQVAKMLNCYINEVLAAAEPEAPAEGEDAAEPAEGEDAKEPAEGEDAAEPTEGEDKPADGEDKDAPTEGEDETKPETKPAE